MRNKINSFEIPHLARDMRMFICLCITPALQENFYYVGWKKSCGCLCAHVHV